jgi:hypothetical protein
VLISPPFAPNRGVPESRVAILTGQHRGHHFAGLNW